MQSMVNSYIGQRGKAILVQLVFKNGGFQKLVNSGSFLVS